MASSSKNPLVLREKITKAIQQGDVKRALALGQRMIKLPLASVTDCMAVAEMGERMSDAQTSVFAIRAALKRMPNDLPLLFEVARVESRSGFSKNAFTHMEQATSLCQSAEEFDELGNNWARMDEAKRAYDAFVRAHELAPGNAHFISNVAVSLSFMGQNKEAEVFYDQAIAKGDQDEFTFLNRSGLRIQTEEANHIAELEQLTKSASEKSENKPFLLYALSKELEDLGRNNESFDVLEKAAAGRRRQVDYSTATNASEFSNITDIYQASAFEETRRGASSSEPIFVVGLPRSGSTLVERILGNHSDIFAAGELQNLGRAVRLKAAEMARAQEGVRFDPMKLPSASVLNEIGKSYVASTRPRTGHTPHFIDKQPTNFIFCGLIALAMPNAKIIHTQRAAMDVCYSMLKQPFREGYFFSYDQRELGEYYIAYKKMMDHWDTVMPGRIIHVAYEDMVADSGATSRNLIEKVGLDWQDACLDHTTNKDASMTASAVQVRQPIYNSSVGKWRQFEDRLTVLKETLEAGGVDVG